MDCKCGLDPESRKPKAKKERQEQITAEPVPATQRRKRKAARAQGATTQAQDAIPSSDSWTIDRKLWTARSALLGLLPVLLSLVKN